MPHSWQKFIYFPSEIQADVLVTSSETDAPKSGILALYQLLETYMCGFEKPLTFEEIMEA